MSRSLFRNEQMKHQILAAAMSSLVALTGCETSSGSSTKYSGEAQIGSFDVKWDRLPFAADRVPSGQTPLLFRFSALNPSAGNGVTEADWEQEAKRRGIAVHHLKAAIGSDAFKGANGNLQTCTILTIQRGLCGKKLGLSLSKRIQMAKTALAAQGKCKWTGFDPAYHGPLAYILGAEDYTLHIAAVC